MPAPGSAPRDGDVATTTPRSRRPWTGHGLRLVAVLAVTAFLMFAAAITTGQDTPAPDAGTSTPAPVDCTTEKCIALTFDDGPGPYTETLLDSLAALDVRATFFLIGRQVPNYPELVARVQSEGHLLGNHTWTHPHLTELTAHEAAEELDRTARAIQDVSGVSPSLVRPPYGSVDDAVLDLLATRGETVVLWDVNTNDSRIQDAAETARRALEGARPGAVVLMHDIHESTVRAVPDVVDALRDQGYVLATVADLLRAQPAEVATPSPSAS